jgi:hypothetical protein
MTKDRYILDTFLSLTSRTYPYGSEHELIGSKVFPKDIKKDAFGNYYYRIGSSNTVFTAHLDTSGATRTKVNHVIDGKLIKTDKKSILGADDKAGVTIMLYMISNNIPGLYYFFVGEESGCIGSSRLSRNFKEKYNRMISFDRRGVDSVITYQSFTRCCSDKFAQSLANELNKHGGFDYRLDEGGIYTDSAEFTNLIPECTNISVGYYSEHTFNESQDISHLEKLSEACLKVDWENLPIVRDPLKTEYREYRTTSSYKKTYNNNYNSGVYNSHNSYNKKSDYGNGYNWLDSDDWPYSEKDNVGVRNKRKRKEKTYYDSGDGKLVDIDLKSLDDNKNFYESVATKILSGSLTKEELFIIKDQFLDMKKEGDRSFYQYLLETINEQNQ